MKTVRLTNEAMYLSTSALLSLLNVSEQLLCMCLGLLAVALCCGRGRGVAVPALAAAQEVGKGARGAPSMKARGRN